jgi:predicted transcriptional regulator
MRPETEMVVQSHTTPPGRLEPMLIRLPPTLASQLRQLAQTTRIRQSDYLREAVSDLLAKYRHLAMEEGKAH